MKTFLIYIDGDYREEQDFKSLKECIEYCQSSYTDDIQIYSLAAEYTVPETVPREWTYH